MKLLTPLILIASAVGLFFMYTDGKYQEVKEEKQIVQDYNDVLSKSKELRDNVELLRKKYNTFTQDNLRKLEKLIPDTIDNVRLVIDIDNISSKYGISVKNIKLQENSKEIGMVQGIQNKTYGTVTLGFSLQAPYQTFLTFLLDLEQSLRLIDVTEISLKSTPIVGVYNYDVTIKTYWLR